MGLRPRHTNNDLDRYSEQVYAELEKKLIESLEYVGEGFVAEARSMTSMQGGFQDITGNLRSSIGYFIVKNGNVIRQKVEVSDKGSDRQTGVKTAKQFLDKIRKSDGLFLYGVAGMDYAREVEARGKNVISLQADTAVIELKSILSGLK